MCDQTSDTSQERPTPKSDHKIRFSTEPDPPTESSKVLLNAVSEEPEFSEFKQSDPSYEQKQLLLKTSEVFPIIIVRYIGRHTTKDALTQVVQSLHVFCPRTLKVEVDRSEASSRTAWISAQKLASGIVSMREAITKLINSKELWKLMDVGILDDPEKSRNAIRCLEECTVDPPDKASILETNSPDELGEDDAMRIREGLLPVFQKNALMQDHYINVAWPSVIQICGRRTNQGREEIDLACATTDNMTAWSIWDVSTNTITEKMTFAKKGLRWIELIRDLYCVAFFHDKGVEVYEIMGGKESSPRYTTNLTFWGKCLSGSWNATSRGVKRVNDRQTENIDLYFLCAPVDPKTSGPGKGGIIGKLKINIWEDESNKFSEEIVPQFTDIEDFDVFQADEPEGISKGPHIFALTPSGKIFDNKSNGNSLNLSSHHKDSPHYLTLIRLTDGRLVVSAWAKDRIHVVYYLIDVVKWRVLHMLECEANGKWRAPPTQLVEYITHDPAKSRKIQTLIAGLSSGFLNVIICTKQKLFLLCTNMESKSEGDCALSLKVINDEILVGGKVFLNKLNLSLMPSQAQDIPFLNPPLTKINPAN